MMKKLLIALTAFVFMMSCKSTQNPSTAQTNNKDKTSIENFIESNTWELTKFKDKLPAEVGFADRAPTIVINDKENKVGGNSGCNSFGGEVNIDGATITISKIFSTKMYCRGVPEQEYFMMLMQPLKFKTKGDTLLLEKDGVVLLEYRLKK